MEALQRVFDYREQKVRTVVVDGNPWFVAKDVCDVLELSNPTVALSRLDEDERSKFNLGRQGETSIVNEAGLYSLILRSRKPEAKNFKRWITHEVIPSIRKTGSYSLADDVKTRNQLATVVKPWLEQFERQLRSINTKLTDAHEEIDILKYRIEEHTINLRLQEELRKAIRERVYSLPGPNYLKFKDFHQIHSDLRAQFKVSGFRDIRVVDFEKALKFIAHWKQLKK